MWKMNSLILMMAVAFISGCADSSAMIRKSSTSTRSDVFQELTDGDTVPKGYADLRITFSLKTHKPGIYSAKDIHGTPDYRMLLNIDGQVIQLQGSLREENVGSRLLDPEAGEGIRYHFNKKLRLKAGTHKIVIAFPVDDLVVERDMVLPEGSSNSLVLEPAYRGTAQMKKRPVSYSDTSFMEGLRGFSVLLNGKPL